MRRHEETRLPALVMTDVDDVDRAFELWEGSETFGRIEVIERSLYLFELAFEIHDVVSRNAFLMIDRHLRSASGIDHDDYQSFIHNVGGGRETNTENASGKEADERFERVSISNGRLVYDTTTVVIEVGDSQSLTGHAACLLEKANRWVAQNHASLVIIVKLYGNDDQQTRNGDPGMLVCLMTGDRGVFRAGCIGNVSPGDIRNLNEHSRHCTKHYYSTNQCRGGSCVGHTKSHLWHGRGPVPHLNDIIADTSHPPDGIEENDRQISFRRKVLTEARVLYAWVNNNGGTSPTCTINLYRLYDIYLHYQMSQAW